MHWSWARDVNGRDRDVDNFSREETETRRWYVLRPRRRDRDHNPDIGTGAKSSYGHFGTKKDTSAPGNSKQY